VELPEPIDDSRSRARAGPYELRDGACLRSRNCGLAWTASRQAAVSQRRPARCRRGLPRLDRVGTCRVRTGGLLSSRQAPRGSGRDRDRDRRISPRRRVRRSQACIGGDLQTRLPAQGRGRHRRRTRRIRTGRRRDEHLVRAPGRQRFTDAGM
ncbi:MAG: hypothetical protein AVDCRST_MAG67-882, partial [uncultured Solirubrobacteraceae bacterium]